IHLVCTGIYTHILGTKISLNYEYFSPQTYGPKLDNFPQYKKDIILDNLDSHFSTKKNRWANLLSKLGKNVSNQLQQIMQSWDGFHQCNLMFTKVQRTVQQRKWMV